ncbi:MAG TPA: pentapeptide repeat-containing protein [bacterium]|nr:pentapeptide repeat-containing protein [bacterium]
MTTQPTSPPPAETPTTTCRYVGPSQQPCPEPAQSEAGLCFWHDPTCSKGDPQVQPRLEALAREGRSLEGYALRGADLHGAELTFGDTSRRVNLSHADLSRASLRDAHMFNVDLRGANLMKAQLNGANLNNARLEDANLLGAELDGTRLERVDWGRHLHQETQARQAHRAGQDALAMTLYGEAEEVYRVLTQVTERIGHFSRAGHFYHKEKVMRRMQMRPWSREWAWSKLVDLLCGYGEETDRVIGFSLLVMLFCAMLYFLLGVRGPEGPLTLNPAAGLARNLFMFGDCVYYSVITFTTVGYGDIIPVGLTRVVAMLEAFTGAFSLSLFVVVFVRKMMR